MLSAMMNVKEVQDILQVSETKAYEVIRQLNDELKEKGFLVIYGKANRKYFNERFYGLPDEAPRVQKG